MKIFDFDRFLETLTGYIETKLEIFKLDLKEEIGLIVARGIVYLLVGLMAIVGMIFGFLAVASWLNAFFQSSFLGYLLVCAFILLIVTIIYLSRESLQNRIWKKIGDVNSPDLEGDDE